MKAPIPDTSRDLFDLSGYCSIVTGASAGIGLAIAEDLAGVAVFLASEASGYITGQTLHVNGGLLMVD